MEEQQQNIPPEIAALHAKSARVEGIIAKKQAIASTIGTPDFTGPEKYVPPTPDNPNYLKELIATTVASSRVRRVIERRSLPALEQIHRSLQDEIAHRQQLLSDAAEYQMNLHELRELQNEGFLTNPNVIDLVEEALKKIDEELHRTPSDTLPTSVENSSPEKITPPQRTYSPIIPSREIPSRPPEAIEASKLTILRLIADGLPLPQLIEELDKDSKYPFTEERAERLMHGIFTKLYARVMRNEADDEELKTWHDISSRVPSLEMRLIRDDFRDYINHYFHPPINPPQRAERKPTPLKEKKPVDPHELIRSVLERVTNRGVKIGTTQRFNPLQVKEVFGSHRKRDELAVERDIVRPQKREGNDYHPSYTLTEAIQMAVIPKYLGATKEQLEELPTVIQLEIEQWIKDHPETISAK